jgi:RecA-family ATPase
MSTAMPGKDVTGEVTFLARELKAPVIAQTFTALGDQAREQGWSHEEYLAAVLGRQVASRAVNGTRMRISAARLPQVRTLEDFTFAHVPAAAREVIAHLATTTFIARKENVVLLGPPGTGKTHIAIALAIKAAEATVLFRKVRPPPSVNWSALPKAMFGASKNCGMSRMSWDRCWIECEQHVAARWRPARCSAAW